MMVKLCELLGVDMFYTESNLYEVEGIGNYKMVLDHGGCKAFHPFEEEMLRVMRAKPAKIIAMLRNPKEVERSRHRIWYNSETCEDISEQTGKYIQAVKDLGIPYLFVWYRDVVDDPAGELTKIKEFLGTDKDIVDAVNYVDPEKCHLKAPENHGGKYGGIAC